MTDRPVVRRHEDLDVYQRSMDLLVSVHALCKQLPPEEKHELISQMRRASKSIPANIAEGFGRRPSEKDMKQFLRIAMASANEMETHLRIAERLGYVRGSELERLVHGYDHVGRQLNQLITNWSKLS